MPRTPLADKAYQQIKDWIKRHRLKPGSRLVIGDLAGQLNMSRTPVREALNRLEQELLVEHQPMRGFVVKTVDLDELADLFELRRTLEVLAARQAAERINRAQLDKIGAILDLIQSMFGKSPNHEVLEKEQQFHIEIMLASGNRHLAEVGKGIFDRIWAVQNLNIIASDELVVAHDQHCQIYQALCGNDAGKASFLMDQHLEKTSIMYLTLLKDYKEFINTFMT